MSIIESVSKKKEDVDYKLKKIKTGRLNNENALYHKLNENDGVQKMENKQRKKINAKRLKKMKENKQMKRRRKINLNFLTMMINKTGQTGQTRDFMTPSLLIDNYKHLLEFQLITILDKQYNKNYTLHL